MVSHHIEGSCRQVESVNFHDSQRTARSNDELFCKVFICRLIFMSLSCSLDTFEKGIERTTVLGKQPYVYTTDCESDSHAKEKADKMTNAFKTQVGKKIEDVLAISEHSDLSGHEDDPNCERKYGLSVH